MYLFRLEIRARWPRWNTIWWRCCCGGQRGTGRRRYFRRDRVIWAKEKLDWLRGYLQLEHGIPSHDTFGRIFGLIDAEQFEAAFRSWVSIVLPAFGRGDSGYRWQDQLALGRSARWAAFQKANAGSGRMSATRKYALSSALFRRVKVALVPK
jgi:DDE_Tnp_1-associated